MSKTMRYLLFILVLIVPLALAACDGDDDKKDSGGGDVTLNQSFTSELGLSVKYPEGWAADEAYGQIMLASSESLLEAMNSVTTDDDAVEKGQIGVVVNGGPLSEMGLPDDMSLNDLFDMMIEGMTSDEMTVEGEAQTVKIGGKDARKLNVKDDRGVGDGLILMYIGDNDVLTVVIALTAPGERSQAEGVVMKIAETVTYSAPSE